MVGRSCDHYLLHLCTVPVSLDSEPSPSHLIDKVAAVIPHKYEVVGLQLGLTLDELQMIVSRHSNLEAFKEIFRVWRNLGPPHYSWRTLIRVLRSASVGEVLLSEKLTSWIKSTSEIPGGMRITFTL